MSIPTVDDCEYWIGSSATPTGDTGAIGGTPVETDLNELLNNLLFHNIPVKATDDNYYTVHYRALTLANSQIANARFANLAGAKQNTAAGTLSVVSTNPSADAGMVANITAKFASGWVQDPVTMVGGTAVGAYAIDALSFTMMEALSGGFPTIPRGNWLLQGGGGQTLAVLYGQDELGTGKGTTMVTTLFSMALATAKNTNLSAADRKTSPTGITSYQQALFTADADESIAVPGNVLLGPYDAVVREFIGVATRLYVPANHPAPVNGRIRFLGAPLGIPKVYP